MCKYCKYVGEENNHIWICEFKLAGTIQVRLHDENCEYSKCCLYYKKGVE